MFWLDTVKIFTYGGVMVDILSMYRSAREVRPW